jgi:hypothetical protein
MIFFCEINKTQQEHVIINSCLLNMLGKKYFDDTINVWIDKTHFEYYQIKPTNIKTIYKRVIKPKKSNKIQWIFKFFSEILMISRIVFSAMINKPEIVFFSSLSPIGNFYLSLIIPFVNNKIKFMIVLHGELELAKSNNWNKEIENIYGKALRSSFKRKFKNRKFLILGASIYNNILKFGLLEREQMIYIDHPYIFPDIKNKREENGGRRPIVFGHFGVAKLTKQSQMFFKLAEAMKEYVLNGTVRFVVIGQVFEEIAPFINEYVSYEKNIDFISANDYSLKAMELDYSLFFYNEESYEFTSSGAVMDAIAYEKPIIALKIKSLEDLFYIHSCVPGYLFDDFETMKNSMELVINEHNHNYINLVNCIKLKKKLFSVDAQFPSFKLQIDKFLIS